jgi:hypothetical protein
MFVNGGIMALIHSRSNYEPSPIYTRASGPSIKLIQERLGFLPTHSGQIGSRNVDQGAPISSRNPVKYADSNTPKTPVLNKPSENRFRAQPTAPGSLPVGYRPSPSGNIPIPPRPRAPSLSIPTPTAPQRPPISQQRTRAESEPLLSKLQSMTGKEIEHKFTEVNTKLDELRRLQLISKQSEQKIKEYASDRTLRKKNPTEHKRVLVEMQTLHNKDSFAVEVGKNDLIKLKNGLKEIKTSDKSYSKRLSETTKNIEKEINNDFFVKAPKAKSMKNAQMKTELAHLEGTIKELVTRGMTTAQAKQDIQKELKKIMIDTRKDEKTILAEIATAKKAGTQLPQNYRRLADISNFNSIQESAQKRALENLESKFKEMDNYKCSDRKLNSLYRQRLNDADIILHSDKPLEKMEEWWDANKSPDEFLSGLTKSNNETFGEDIPFRKPITGLGLWDRSLDILSKRDEKNKKNYEALKQNIHQLADGFNRATPALGGFYYKADIEKDLVDFRPADDMAWKLKPDDKTRVVASMRNLYGELDQIESSLKGINFLRKSNKDLGQTGEVARQFIIQDAAKGKNRLENLAAQLGLNKADILPRHP